MPFQFLVLLVFYFYFYFYFIGFYLVFFRAVAFRFSFHAKKTPSTSLRFKQNPLDLMEYQCTKNLHTFLTQRIGFKGAISENEKVSISMQTETFYYISEEKRIFLMPCSAHGDGQYLEIEKMKNESFTLYPILQQTQKELFVISYKGN